MQKLALARSFEQWTSKVLGRHGSDASLRASTTCVRLSSFAPLVGSVDPYFLPTAYAGGLHCYAASRLLASLGEFRTTFDSRPGCR
jgi:hypothetical protein